MRYGVTFPQNDIGSDPAVIREYAQTAEAGGFDYLATFEHVLGAHPDRFIGVDIGFPSPPYTHVSEFHEVFALFSYMAGLTSRIEFNTSILILPQRQTALVAKQAAALAMLSGGRFRMGVGIGWNFTEFEALSEDFHNRGRRVEEQITVLRKLWTEPLVTFDGRWHHLDRVGIAPLPLQPIPIWIGGGTSDRLIKRIARLADGWMPALPLDNETADVLGRMHAALAAEERDPASLGLQVGISVVTGGPAEWVATARRWKALGATHIGIGARAPGTPPLVSLEQAIAARNLLADELG